MLRFGGSWREGQGDQWRHIEDYVSITNPSGRQRWKMIRVASSVGNLFTVDVENLLIQFNLKLQDAIDPAVLAKVQSQTQELLAAAANPLADVDEVLKAIHHQLTDSGEYATAEISTITAAHEQMISDINAANQERKQTKVQTRATFAAEMLSTKRVSNQNQTQPADAASEAEGQAAIAGTKNSANVKFEAAQEALETASSSGESSAMVRVKMADATAKTKQKAASSVTTGSADAEAACKSPKQGMSQSEKQRVDAIIKLQSVQRGRAAKTELRTRREEFSSQRDGPCHALTLPAPVQMAQQIMDKVDRHSMIIVFV